MCASRMSGPWKRCNSLGSSIWTCVDPSECTLVVVFLIYFIAPKLHWRVFVAPPFIAPKYMLFVIIAPKASLPGNRRLGGTKKFLFSRNHTTGLRSVQGMLFHAPSVCTSYASSPTHLCYEHALLFCLLGRCVVVACTHNGRQG